MNSTPRFPLRVGRLLLGAAAAGALVAATAGAATPDGAQSATRAGAAPAASALAAAKQTGCRPGTFAVTTPVTRSGRAGRRTARTRIACRSLATGVTTAARAQRAVAAALPTPRELRAALPRRARTKVPLARLTKLDRALDRALAKRLASASATARMAAGGAGDCAAAPTFTIDPTRSTGNGVTAVTTGGGWAAGSGSTKGQLVEIAAELGRGATATRTTKDCISWDPCPDPSGIVHGTYEYSYSEGLSATADGVTARQRVTLTITARLTGRVGDDARVQTFDWDADGTMEVTGSVSQPGRRVQHVPTRIVRLHLKARGVDPRKRDATGTRPSATARGPKGARLSASEFESAQAMYGIADGAIRDQASRALLEAESHWYAGKCLTVVFDPEDPGVTPGQRVDVKVAVKDAGGREAPVPFTVEPYDGAVGPTSGTSTATVTWTAPQQLDRGSFATFEVSVVSKRGRAEGIHHAHALRSPWFRTTFSGTASYSRHEMGDGLPQIDSRFRFAWRSTTALRFPLFDGLPEGAPMMANTDTTEITGELDGWRTDGGGISGCGVQQPDATDQVGMATERRTASGYRLTIEPFSQIKTAGPAPLECDNGTFLWWSKGTREAMTIDVDLTQQQLDGQDTIVIPLSQQRPLDPNCWGGESNGDWACEQSVSWQGELKLERIPAPPGR